MRAGDTPANLTAWHHAAQLSSELFEPLYSLSSPGQHRTARSSIAQRQTERDTENSPVSPLSCPCWWAAEGLGNSRQTAMDQEHRVGNGVPYTCGNCGSEVLIKPGDVIQCRECGYRIMWVHFVAFCFISFLPSS